MKTTTALRKISALRKKIRVIQGGQGAGKTIAILMILINHASSVADREIIIGSEELTKMRLTVIKDFVTIMKAFGLFNERRFIAGTLYRFPNGSFIKFIGLDKEDIGKGLRCHVFYLNEANKTKFETYREIASRADNVYLDYNPNTKFWVQEHVLIRDDADYIKLTYQDNEYLKDSEREEIELYYTLGYHADGTVKSEYWANKWRVYGLGETGMLEGVVFANWSVIPEVPKEAYLEGFGTDFGFTNSATATEGILKWNNRYIIDEWIHDTGMTNPDIAQMMHVQGYAGELMYCDSAEPKSIEELSRAGINAHPCANKSDIHEYAIDKLQRDHFYITARSEMTISNFQNFVWAQDKFGAFLNKAKNDDNAHAPHGVIYFIGTEDKYDGRY